MTGKVRDAYELIKDPERWTEGAYARNRQGQQIPPTRSAAKLCALGALLVCNANVGPLTAIAQELFPQVGDLETKGKVDPFGGAVVWINDNLGHDAVMQLFEKAIIEEEGSL